MPLVIDRSNKGDSGEPDKDKRKTGVSTPTGKTTKAARRKAALEESRFEKIGPILLGIIIVAALVFTVYYLFSSRKPVPTNELNGSQPNSRNPSPAAQAGQRQGAAGGAAPGTPRSGEGPAPAPRFGGQGATGGR